MDKQEIKDYIKKNLKIKLKSGFDYSEDSSYIEVILSLEDEIFSKDTFYTD